MPPRSRISPWQADSVETPRSRAVIEGVDPEIDAGRFPAKTIAGDPFVVDADVFADGHDALRCVLLHRTERQRKWREVEMEPLGNDRWRAAFTPDEPGRCVYTVLAWVDRWGSWVRDLRKRVEAGQDVRVDLRIGAGILDDFAEHAEGRDDDAAARRMTELAERLRGTAEEWTPPPAGDEGAGHGSRAAGPTGSDGAGADDAFAGDLGADEAHPPEALGGTGPDPDDAAPAPDADPDATSPIPLLELVEDLEGDAGAVAREHDPRRFATRHHRELEVVVDRERAAFSAWYEFFPRSTGPAGAHGTFESAADFLPYVAEMGFDVVYLPPIHPIGRTKRKGPGNDPVAAPGDHGSPWAIGAEEGGHTAIHPELGTLDDFRAFRERAEALGLEVALDVAFQASPDHPWVEAHPEWFRHRPDGTIQYAENPPKKYEDIYPIDFETEDWRGLWDELKGVFEFWMDQGVRIFRVDNPHTKSLRFWSWCVPELKKKDPGLILLSEAFTRPKLMKYLAKAGFTQSYTYFAWRHHPWEMREYMTELTRSEARHHMRPNFWPNTPDILTEDLQSGSRGVFMMRHVLAATLTASYGIYGPAFELLEHRPAKPGSEEYLDSEKYQLRDWDLDRPDSLAPFIARVNRIRRAHPALRRNDTLTFHGVDNDRLLVYSKRAGDNVVLCVVNMDLHNRQSGWVDLDLDALGLDEDRAFTVRDLLGDATYGWQGRRNYVELDPHVVPAHVLHVRPSAVPEAMPGNGADGPGVEAARDEEREAAHA